MLPIHKPSCYQQVYQCIANILTKGYNPSRPEIFTMRCDLPYILLLLFTSQKRSRVNGVGKWEDGVRDDFLIFHGW